jgi:hypothetical protein
MSSKGKKHNKHSGSNHNATHANEHVQPQSQSPVEHKPLEAARAVQQPPPQGKQAPVAQAPQEQVAKKQAVEVPVTNGVNGDKKPSARTVELVWPWEGNNVLVAV